jgi:TonB family protein
VLPAAALSGLAHGALLMVMVVRLLHGGPAPAAAEGLGAPASELELAIAAWIDVVPEVAPPAPPVPTPPVLEGDQAQLAPVPQSPGHGTTEKRQAAPAADSGAGAGRRPAEATRRDLSTLRTRVADGSRFYRQEREHTAARATSPQPIRQEPVVGMGDTSRTLHPGGPVAAPDTELPAQAEGEAAPELKVDDRVALADGDDATRGDGPLDAEQGRRRFDVEAGGVARDDRWTRATSDATQPGRIEVSHPVAAGTDPAGEGNGPSLAAGAVSRPSAGAAPSVHGALVDAPPGPSVAMSAAEREYQRSQAEIRRRVVEALRFPRRLALSLDQGETVLHFVVRPDGKLDGAVRVVKSAGFEEFDAAAVSAVTRAAPFPATGRAIPISMPVAFDNPLVR